MVINIKYMEYKTTTYYFIGIILILFVFIQLIYIFLIANNEIYLENFTKMSNLFFFGEISKLEENERSTITVLLGILFFGENPFLLLLIGFILLITTIGSILLAHKRTKKGMISLKI